MIDQDNMIDFSDVGIEEAVGLAIGMASMCWIELDGQQVFDSSRALEINNALMRRISEAIQ